METHIVNSRTLIEDAVAYMGGTIRCIAHIAAEYALTRGVSLLIADTKICDIIPDRLAIMHPGDTFVIGRKDAEVHPDWVYPGPIAPYSTCCADGLNFHGCREIPAKSPYPYISPIHCFVQRKKTGFDVYDCSSAGTAVIIK